MNFFVEISTQAASYFSSLSRDKEVRVLTKYVVREDAALLFGFKDSFERDCFNQLQTVPGIGAKQALKILSAISVNDFIKALEDDLQWEKEALSNAEAELEETKQCYLDYSKAEAKSWENELDAFKEWYINHYMIKD